jgi:hypothetical protein
MKSVLKVGLILLVLFCSVSLFAQDPMTAKAQDFIASLGRGDYQKAYLSLNSDLGFKVSADNLRQWWGQITSKAGSFVEIKESKVESKNDFQLVIAVCKFEKGLVDLQIAVDGMGKVAGLNVKDHKGGAPQAASANPQPPAAAQPS